MGLVKRAQLLHPKGVAVLVEGMHLCSMMRGMKKAGISMVTRVNLGAFETDATSRQDFQVLLNKAI